MGVKHAQKDEVSFVAGAILSPSHKGLQKAIALVRYTDFIQGFLQERQLRLVSDTQRPMKRQQIGTDTKTAEGAMLNAARNVSSYAAQLKAFIAFIKSEVHAVGDDFAEELHTLNTLLALEDLQEGEQQESNEKEEEEEVQEEVDDDDEAPMRITRTARARAAQKRKSPNK